MHEGNRIDDQPGGDRPEEAEGSTLPADFTQKGNAIIKAISDALEDVPVVTAASALTSTLFAVATNEALQQEARDALALMIHDLSLNVRRFAGMDDERLGALMLERGATFVETGAPKG